MGAGPGCDVQYLYSKDILGENRGHLPRHAKVYRNFAAEFDRLQRERVAAYGEFIADVAFGSFSRKRACGGDGQGQIGGVSQTDHMKPMLR